eukprot:10551780-Ditylum_brightwellii.AAC.1
MTELRYENDQLKDALDQQESEMNCENEKLKDAFAQRESELKYENEQLEEVLAQKESELQKQLLEFEEVRIKVGKMVELKNENDQLKVALKQKEYEVQARLDDFEEAKNKEMEIYVRQRETLEVSMSNAMDATREKAQREKIELISEYSNEINRLKEALEMSVEKSVVESLVERTEELQQRVVWMEPRLSDRSKNIYKMKTFVKESPVTVSERSTSAFSVVSPQA